MHFASSGTGALAAIPEDARRVAADDGVLGDVLGHHRSGADHGAVSDTAPGEDDGAGTEPDVVLDHHRRRRLVALVPHGDIDVGGAVVPREDHHARAHHDVRPDRHRAVNDAADAQAGAVTQTKLVTQPEVGAVLDVHVLAARGQDPPAEQI